MLACHLAHDLNVAKYRNVNFMEQILLYNWLHRSFRQHAWRCKRSWIMAWSAIILRQL